MEEHLYENLCKDFVKRELVSGVITDDNFNTDYAISLGGDGTFLEWLVRWGETNTYYWSEYGTFRLSC